MDPARPTHPSPPTAEVLDFDAALLAASAQDVREDVMAEAMLLADAFAPEGRAEELRLMAAALISGERGDPSDRARARLLAAALRRLAG